MSSGALWATGDVGHMYHSANCQSEMLSEAHMALGCAVRFKGLFPLWAQIEEKKKKKGFYFCSSSDALLSISDTFFINYSLQTYSLTICEGVSCRDEVPLQLTAASGAAREGCNHLPGKALLQGPAPPSSLKDGLFLISSEMKTNGQKTTHFWYRAK